MNAMTEIINLRTARKRSKRRSEEANAEAQRLIHGQPKHLRTIEAGRRERDERSLEGHKIETGDPS